jgi:hypothetical protein
MPIPSKKKNFLLVNTSFGFNVLSLRVLPSITSKFIFSTRDLQTSRYREGVETKNQQLMSISYKNQT